MIPYIFSQQQRDAINDFHDFLYAEMGQYCGQRFRIGNSYIVRFLDVCIETVDGPGVDYDPDCFVVLLFKDQKDNCLHKVVFDSSEYLNPDGKYDTVSSEKFKKDFNKRYVLFDPEFDE